MPKHLRAVRWLAGPFILVAVGLGILYGHWPLVGLALVIAAFPSMYAVDIPWGRGPKLHGLRSALILLSGLAIAAILWGQHSLLPTWLAIAAAIYTLCCLPAAALDFVLVIKPELRRKIYERRVLRGWPQVRSRHAQDSTNWRPAVPYFLKVYGPALGHCGVACGRRLERRLSRSSNRRTWPGQLGEEGFEHRD